MVNIDLNASHWHAANGLNIVRNIRILSSSSRLQFNSDRDGIECDGLEAIQ